MTNWPTVLLGDVITHRKEFIVIDELTTYRRCKVQLHTKGVVLRDHATGSDIKTKKQQVCRTGEFLVAEIDAKFGGYGLVPEDLDGAVVSSHYFLFDINETKLNRHFLGYYIKTPAFHEQVQAQGSTNYSAIRPSHVLEYSIPLPPLGDQQRLVEYLDALSGKINEAKQLRKGADLETAALTNAARRILIGEQPDKSWIQLRSYVAEIQNGWSPLCEKRKAVEGEWAVLKVGAVSFGTYDPSENKALPTTLSPIPEYEVRTGDFLMSRANTSELVGACAYVEQTPSRRMLSDKLFRFVFRPDTQIDPHYLNHVLKSPAVRDQIVRLASGTSPTMKNISKDKVLSLLIPNHSVPEQKELAARLSGTYDLIGKAKNHQLELSQEIDAMLPGILDQAFNEAGA